MSILTLQCSWTHNFLTNMALMDLLLFPNLHFDTINNTLLKLFLSVQTASVHVQVKILYKPYNQTTWWFWCCFTFSEIVHNRAVHTLQLVFSFVVIYSNIWEYVIISLISSKGILFHLDINNLHFRRFKSDGNYY